MGFKDPGILWGPRIQGLPKSKYPGATRCLRIQGLPKSKYSGALGGPRVQGIQGIQGTTRDLRIQESINQGAPRGPKIQGLPGGGPRAQGHPEDHARI